MYLNQIICWFFFLYTPCCSRYLRRYTHSLFLSVLSIPHIKDLSGIWELSLSGKYSSNSWMSLMNFQTTLTDNSLYLYIGIILISARLNAKMFVRKEIFISVLTFLFSDKIFLINPKIHFSIRERNIPTLWN